MKKAAGAGARTATAVFTGAGPRSTWRATSSLVTRPCGPVPGTAARSTPCSAAIRRVTGVARTRFMQVGDTVELELRDAAGRNLFGTIRQKVVAG